jgi:formylglycine-generating enzyme required for sulfatase activity
MKLLKPLSVVATFALCGQLLAEVPKVENIRASQLDGTKFVEILYDVEDAENDKLTIRVEISADGGERYNVPARTFEGAVGANIDPGKDKKITWNAGLDWDGEFSDKMRVRITASDGKGLPGLEWSKEIPPGGFLMGQDGGPEGSGPSIHLNIEYPYWITKYEITNKQFTEFMNLAYAANKIRTDGRIKGFKTLQPSEQTGKSVLGLGDSQNIRWNINKFEVVKNAEHAVIVSFTGAKSFAEFYGYDLPTEIEWEKAARGPEFDDGGEHRLYSWGNEDQGSYYSGDKPVGWFNGINTAKDVVNGYGIYDLSGNDEWTNSLFKTLDKYGKKVIKPNLTTEYSLNNKYYVMKGYRTLYHRQSMYSTTVAGAFRLVRRD